MHLAVRALRYVFPESQGTLFKNRSGGGGSSLTQVVSLNAGTRYLNSGGQEATPARDYSGALIQTNTTPSKIMTVIVHLIPAPGRRPVPGVLQQHGREIRTRRSTCPVAAGSTSLGSSTRRATTSPSRATRRPAATSARSGHGPSSTPAVRTSTRKGHLTPSPGRFASMPPALRRGRPAFLEDRELRPFWLAGVVGLTPRFADPP